MYSRVLVLIMVVLFSFNGCGNSSRTVNYVLDKDNFANYESMKIFKDYAKYDGDSKAPTIEDYKNISIDDVDNTAILNDANEAISYAEEEQVASPALISMLLYDVGVLTTHLSRPASVEVTQLPVVTTPPPPALTTPPPVPTSVSMELKERDKKDGITLELVGGGRVTVEIGEGYDTKNTYRLMDKNGFSYLLKVNEKLKIDNSYFNKNKEGTYIVYYTFTRDNKEILRIWRFVTVSSRYNRQPSAMPPVTTTAPPPPSSTSLNGSHFTEGNISIKFDFKFPTNSVRLGDASLDFNPKDFTATQKIDSGTVDITRDIKVLITREGKSVASYNKSKKGSYLFEYIFNDNTFGMFTFTIIAKPVATPTPSG